MHVAAWRTRLLTQTSLCCAVLCQVRGLQFKDFELAMRSVRPSVPKGTLERYVKWDRKFGVQATGGVGGGGRGCLGC